MPIDYSKWDHLDDYSDDDENEDNNGDQVSGAATTPTVTRLDAPSRVTFGGGSASVQPSPSAAATTDTTMTVAAASKPQHVAAVPWMQKGGVVTTPSGQSLYWSQDRYSVSLRLVIPDEERIQSVQVQGILPYGDRHCAMGTHKPQLAVTSKNGTELLRGDLPHHVHLAQGEDEDVDWSVERQGTDKFVMITLYKAVPMEGVFVWWRRPLLEFPEVDIDREEGSSDATPSGASKSKEFLQAWEEAHRQFREKKQNEAKTKL